MKAKKKTPLTANEMRKSVKTKVRKEYEAFLSSYRKLDDEKRFRKMVEDAEMIGMVNLCLVLGFSGGIL